MRVAISQSNFLPWIGYFHLISSVDTFVIYDVVQFTRRDWRNRNRIKGPEGEQWMTVPVKTKGNYDARIDEIEVDGDKWRGKLCKTIENNYRPAKHFAEISAELFPLLQNPEPSLHKMNVQLLAWAIKNLQIPTKILSTAEGLFKSSEPTIRLLEICESLSAKEYISGPAAKAYMELSHFEKAGVGIQFFEYPKYPEYPQLFSEFLPSLSFIDIVMNIGWDGARSFIQTKGR